MDVYATRLAGFVAFGLSATDFTSAELIQCKKMEIQRMRKRLEQSDDTLLDDCGLPRAEERRQILRRLEESGYFDL